MENKSLEDPDIRAFESLALDFVDTQVVDTMEAEASGLIEVPAQDERAGTVGDHLNFRLVAPTKEENLAFLVRLSVPPQVSGRDWYNRSMAAYR